MLSIASLKPATHFLKLNEEGQPFLQGSLCKSCGHTFLGEREHCAKCLARDCMSSCQLSDKGTLYNYTIVHRSYPNITVPFVSAIVDLEGGGTVKGNLLEVGSNPKDIEYDMPIEVVFKEAIIATPAGAGYFSHFFLPANNN